MRTNPDAQMCDAGRWGLLCTLDDGHDGEHIAEGASIAPDGDHVVMARWSTQ